MAPSMALKTLAVITLLVAVFTSQASAKKHFLYWTVENATLTRDCHSVTVATVNGMSPGPTVMIDEDDTLVVTVTNKQIYPVTIHWHGIHQKGSNYADGTAYITECPIQEGGSSIYEFTVSGQSGTFFYHAHINWLRATVHGALIVRPKVMPPYGAVEAEIPIILGDWLGMDPNAYGQGSVYNVPPLENITSITPTVNGKPGPLYNCSSTVGTSQFKVKPNKTYLLRIISTALNNDYFFRVGGHKVTVVAADGNYLKPVRSNLISLTPGQTTDVLLITSKTPGKYFFGFVVGAVPVGVGYNPPHIAALGLFEYTNAVPSKVIIPKFPNNIFTAKPMDKYQDSLKSLYKYTLKEIPDQDLIYTVNIAFAMCTPSEPCFQKLVGTIQNISFDDPVGTSILQAYAGGVNGVYTTDIPDKPPTLNLSLVSPEPSYVFASRGTRVKTLNYGDVVQLVFQNMFGLGGVDHPFHLHGHDFYVVGRGYGIYDPSTDPAKFNLVDPPLFNTYGLPNAGWLAIRFHANNPGVWFMHCHFERHTKWGMSMVFITKNGGGVTLQPPMHPLPMC